MLRRTDTNPHKHAFQPLSWASASGSAGSTTQEMAMQVLWQILGTELKDKIMSILYSTLKKVFDLLQSTLQLRLIQ